MRWSYLKNGSHAERYFVIKPPTAAVNKYISVVLIPFRQKSPLGTVQKKMTRRDYIVTFITHAVQYRGVMSETVTIRDGDTVETCDVKDTWSYYGDVVAEVKGDTISGFVVIN